MAAPLCKDETFQLKTFFEDWLKRQGVNPHRFEQKSHPILRYEPRAAVSQQRVLLTGDAAGVDPLFGEGISSALALGIIAADRRLTRSRQMTFPSRIMKREFVRVLLVKQCAADVS